jgi:DNA-binding transcriptional regulator YdaS (Cro superfamily)
MNPREYFKTMPRGEIKRIEQKIGRPLRYLNKMLDGNRSFTVKDALLIEKETGGAVKREEVMPDFDWSLMAKKRGKKT